MTLTTITIPRASVEQVLRGLDYAAARAPDPLAAKYAEVAAHIRSTVGDPTSEERARAKAIWEAWLADPRATLSGLCRMIEKEAK